MAFKHASQTSRGVGRLTAALARSTALVAPALALAGLMAPMAAQAADASATDVQAVVVTGSRIKQPNLTSDSPLTTVGQQDVKQAGVTTVENLLNNLPQVYGGQNLGQSINSTGTAEVDLRGLGAKRTLVLVDGRRLPPGDASSPVADLNNIPTALIDRVDLVTGGASAVYGADAVAGVVNFIMKRNFQGIQLDAQFSANQHGQQDSTVQALENKANIPVPSNKFDGQQYTASVVIGVNAPDDKGNITVFASYFNAQPVTQAQRDYSACGLQALSNGANVYDKYKCAGSSNSAYGRFNFAANTGTNPADVNSTFHDNPNGTNTFVTSSVPAYNFNTLSYLQREDTRYNIGYMAHYELNKHIDIYSDFMFMEDHTQAQYAPSGFFAGGGPQPRNPYWQINCNNPLMSYAQQVALCGSAAGTSAIGLAEIGYRFASAPRNGDFRHDTFKIDLGARGDINDAWSYDAYIQLGESSYTQYATGYASLNRLQNALLVDPATGLCYSGGSCVPLNIFTAKSAGISPAAAAYVLTPGIQQGTTTEQVASASVTGDLGKYGVKSPWAADGVKVALGTEYRRENLVFNPDQESASGDLSGGGATPATAGTFQVAELFGEAQIPLVSDKPWIKSLVLSPGYRFSDYTSTGNTETYKLDASYQPTSDVRLRYTYNRAVRAPNINELYTPQSNGGLWTGSDPCAKPGSAGGSLWNSCLAQGVPLSVLQAGGTSDCPANQCSELTGGNAYLKPETADTYTFGAVFTPRILPRFSLSVDYFNIRVSNLISAGYGGASAIVSGCFSGQTFLCSQISRAPGSGQLFGAGYVVVTNVNTGFLQTKGIDVSASYSQPLGDWGRLDVKSTGTYTAHFVTEPNAAAPGLAGSGTYDCAGLFGATCGQPLPHWRSSTRFTWVSPWSITTSLNWRYIGSSKVDYNEGNTLVNSGYGPGTVYDKVDAKTGDISYFDVSFQWKVKEGYVLRGGVNNVLDTDPARGSFTNSALAPYGGGNGNTFPGLYDTLGRNFYIGLTANY